MKSNWIVLSVFLQAHVLAADAQVFGLTDPRLCYLLDGLLLIYAIIITALLFREKLSKKVPVGDTDDTFSKANQNTRDPFSSRADAELGGRRGKHRSPDNSIYQGLEKEKLNDPYNAIGVKQPRKKGKGNEMLYQGLNTGRRETYDALQMKKLQH
ncbi:T-cell surface glycoprotein CD3 zeta chain isoform X2 [Rana temporaria]|uniref:T-cell surface glycoprotein CD3 zeta chain isoform X2 n=1 Tax=Rana temporaria TaxID=8407 RepID=UPI001AAD16DB|nr:T-cell surface glycoprotein CD3 zeta chain isoform X2 [Rana temporaria]